MPTSISPPAMPIGLTAGDRMPSTTFGPLTRTDIVRYAGAGGDFNPIHHDEEFAREAGMPSVFGIGMHTAGILGQRLAAWVGPTHLRSFGVRFVAQVWPGDVLTFAGEVRNCSSADGVEELADVDLEVTRQTGEAVLRASAVVVVAATAD